jgi:hypothetical protein
LVFEISPSCDEQHKAAAAALHTHTAAAAGGGGGGSCNAFHIQTTPFCAKRSLIFIFLQLAENNGRQSVSRHR